jgi:hypothetical protein
MKISGHRTASVFTRYDITDERDIKTAAVQVGTFNAKLAQQWHSSTENDANGEQATEQVVQPN